MKKEEGKGNDNDATSGGDILLGWTSLIMTSETVSKGEERSINLSKGPVPGSFTVPDGSSSVEPPCEVGISIISVSLV